LTPGRLACPTRASTYRGLACAPRPQFERDSHIMFDPKMVSARKSATASCGSRLAPPEKG
jgi:hypothetical protein